MIEQYLVSKLGTIEHLQEQVYPTAAPIGDIEPPFCIYTRVSGNITRDLSGNPIFYTDVFRLDLTGEDNDTLCALAQLAVDILNETNTDAGDAYIFSASAEPGAPDGFDMTIEAHRRSITYTVSYWR